MNRIYFLLLVLISFNFSSEEDTLAILKNKSTNYFANHKRTKLELVFNQPVYAPGDTVRFGTTCLYASDYKPVTGREIVSICLFDQSGTKKLTRWAEVINGRASNEMVIPKDFPSGNYKLVAFTEWMKNFNASLFFQQQFLIVGKYTINEILKSDTLSFNPEGGSLIEGIENNVAIRYHGKLSKANVSVKEAGKEITSFEAVNDSVHLFRMTPQRNATYTAYIGNGNDSKQFSLPIAKPSGVSLQIESDESQIIVRAEYSADYSSHPENFFLGVFSNSGLVFQSQMEFDNNRKAKLLLPASLPKGITQLILFDSKFNLLASRVIHLGQPTNKMVSLVNLQDKYATRQEVKADLKIKDKDGYIVPGFYTCRVVKDDLFMDASFENMSYLIFQSDISNTFPLKRGKATPQTINNYLITQTCPWFEWNNILRNDQSANMIKSQQNLSLSGRVKFTKTNKHVPDSTLVMFFLEKGLLGYETHTDAKGNFSFPLLLAINHPDRFFYTASLKGRDTDDISVELNDPDSSLFFSANPWMIDRNSSDPYAAYSSQVQTINNSYSFFGNKAMSADSVQEPNKAMEEELNGADLTVNINDYLMMPTMEEVIREIVRAVEYRKINGRQVLRVYTTNQKSNYHAGPLLVIDGMITKDPAFLLALKPTEVISIKIVKDSKKLFTLGSLGANGVILVKTKRSSNIVKEKHHFDFVGLLPKSQNLSSQRKDLQMPDLRSCLFWTAQNFSGRVEENLLFSTSDDVGKFKIQISGITEDGSPFYLESPFQVKQVSN